MTNEIQMTYRRCQGANPLVQSRVTGIEENECIGLGYIGVRLEPIPRALVYRNARLVNSRHHLRIISI